MLNPEIVNAVGGGDLNQELDLQVLFEAVEGEEVRYDPEYWPGLYIRFTEESPAIMVFRTGKYNIAGAESIEELTDSNEEFLSTFEKLGITPNPDSTNPPANFEIRNLVFLDRYQEELALNPVAVGLGLENAEYEPEQFPGLLFRPSDDTGTFLIFRTGKIVLTGTKNPESAMDSFESLFAQLDEMFS
jgi:transcription initiation factor TFIID TATA-box-binding protein